jgi:hypothetical protein
MDLATHTFPLPELETNKLEAVTEELRQQPGYKKFNDLIRANTWPSVMAGFALGLALGAGIRMLAR